MATEKLTVVIKPDGTFAMSFEGFEGRDCLKASHEFRKRLSELGVDVSLQAIEMNDGTPPPAIPDATPARTRTPAPTRSRR